MASKTCAECGLPTPICSAPALYRMAIERYKRKDYGALIDFAADAEEAYERYRAENRQ